MLLCLKAFYTASLTVLLLAAFWHAYLLYFNFLLIIISSFNFFLCICCCLTVAPACCSRNLAVLFDSNLYFYDHISSITKSCFSLSRDLGRIRPLLDQQTARNIAAALVHSKLDYCNCLFIHLPKSQPDSLQLVINFAVRSVTNFSHETPVFKSLHLLKTPQSIQYKIMSVTYNV